MRKIKVIQIKSLSEIILDLISIFFRIIQLQTLQRPKYVFLSVEVFQELREMPQRKSHS